MSEVKIYQVTAYLWDKKSPVNALSAEEASAYFIKQNGNDDRILGKMSEPGAVEPVDWDKYPVMYLQNVTDVTNDGRTGPEAWREQWYNEINFPAPVPPIPPSPEDELRLSMEILAGVHDDELDTIISDYS